MVVTTCVPSDLYGHIYQFLLGNGLQKTAKYFRKETGKDILPVSGPDLVEIFSKYFSNSASIFSTLKEPISEVGFCNKAGAIVIEDDVSNHISSTEAVGKKESSNRKRKIPESAGQEQAESEIPRKSKRKNKTVAIGAVTNGEPVLREESLRQIPIVEKVEHTGSQGVSKTKKKKKEKQNNVIVVADETDTSELIIVDQVPEAGRKVVSDCPKEEVQLKSLDSDKSKEKKTKKGAKADLQPRKNAPFRRVVADEIPVPDHLRDNSFEAKRGSLGDWGERANKDLKFTRGKSFRHEKTKKKRGSYKGGVINTSVNSIKFDE